jgi:hypothetical protein
MSLAGEFLQRIGELEHPLQGLDLAAVDRLQVEAATGRQRLDRRRLAALAGERQFEVIRVAAAATEQRMTQLRRQGELLQGVRHEPAEELVDHRQHADDEDFAARLRRQAPGGGEFHETAANERRFAPGVGHRLPLFGALAGKEAAAVPPGGEPPAAAASRGLRADPQVALAAADPPGSGGAVTTAARPSAGGVAVQRRKRDSKAVNIGFFGRVLGTRRRPAVTRGQRFTGLTSKATAVSTRYCCSSTCCARRRCISAKKRS